MRQARESGVSTDQCIVTRSVPGLSAVIACILAGFLLAVPSSALAVYARPFVRQITGTPSGMFSLPAGVTVGAGNTLWVAEIRGEPPFPLDEFRPAQSESEFIKTVNIEGPESSEMARPGSIASASSTTEDLYVTGGAYETSKSSAILPVEVFSPNGAFVKRFSTHFHMPVYLAIDNSTSMIEDPSACGTAPLPSPTECFIYVSSEGVVDKFNTAGEPESFTGSAQYIKGNEIVGPSGPIAVDSHGNIFVGNDEYTAAGEFVRSFQVRSLPCGGGLEDVAFDPAVEHVLFSVSNVNCGGAVEEFDVKTGDFLKMITISETASNSRLSNAEGVTVDSLGDLYVVDPRQNAVDLYGPGHFLPDVKTAEASERTTGTAVLNGSVNPEVSADPEQPVPALSECTFEYIEERLYDPNAADPYEAGEKAPCVPAAGAIPGEGLTLVSAKVSGLKSGVTYKYRLVATVAGKQGGQAASQSLAFTAPHAPRIDSTSVGNVSSASADLRAQIAPLGSDTTYRFEYDTSEYTPDGPPHGSSVPVPAADIGSGGPAGSGDASLVQHVDGLQPGTTYYFRVVASNAIGTEAGAVCEGQRRADCAFTTLPSPSSSLPDGRAYELVTPANKGSAEDMFALPETTPNSFYNNDRGYASESGEQFMLYTRAAFGAFPASGENGYVFSRVAPATGGHGGGWSYQALASPSLGLQGLDAYVFDPFDFSRVGLRDGVGSESSEGGTREMSLVGPPGGPYSTLWSARPVHVGEIGEATQIVGASRSLSQVVVESTSGSVCPGTQGRVAGRVLCEWNGGGECGAEASNCSLVNVDNKGALLSPCGATIGEEFNTTLPGLAHDAVSADGSRVFFTAPDPLAHGDGPGCWNEATSENAPQLYVRSGSVTTRVSKPTERGVPDACKAPWTGCGPAIYVGASEDGSRVFFATTTELTKQAVKLGLHTYELYEYDVETRTLTRISGGEPDSPGATGGTQVVTVPAISADGSAVYFTAFTRLTATAPATNGASVDLYRYDTMTGTTAFIANINTYDYPSTDIGAPTLGAAVQAALNPAANWYTTPDGRYLLFDTGVSLTGYDTKEAGHNECLTLDNFNAHYGICNELYRYDSVTRTLICISCNPTGSRPHGPSFFGHSTGVEIPSGGPVRAMSDDGSYIFFDSSDPLVPQAENQTLNVYEWHDGRLSLISSGEDSTPSYFLAQSPAVVGGRHVEAANVFFGTHAKLVRRDTDTAGDVYDARIGGGFLEQEETGECEGDACQRPPATPIDATPASLTFSGHGNLIEPPVRHAKAKVLTRAQKLARALRACRRRLGRERRACEALARKRYGRASRKSARRHHAVHSLQRGKR